jgi:hypothetical protein
LTKNGVLGSKQWFIIKYTIRSAEIRKKLLKLISITLIPGHRLQLKKMGSAGFE